MSCLIIKNDGIGDLILSSGLISSVGKLFDGQVDLITCYNNREIAEGIQPLRKRYYISRNDLRFKKKFIEKMGLLIPHINNEDLQVLKSLEKQHYDTIICLRRFILQSTLVLMRKIRGKVKYCAWEFPTNASWGMAEQATRGWKHYTGSAEVLSELNYNKAFLESVFHTTLTADPHLSFCKKQPSLPATRRLAFGLGGSSPTWPSGNWIELAMRLASEGWNLLLLGGDNVTDLAKHIAEKIPGADNRVGQLAWRQTSDLLFECEGYIGNDTGLSHFASLINKKCVVILGGGTFRRFFPWPGTNNQHIIYHGLECFDCRWDCKFQDRFCLNLVRPSDVLNYFNDLINCEPGTECDLNSEDKNYKIAWRIKPDLGKSRKIRHT